MRNGDSTAGLQDRGSVKPQCCFAPGTILGDYEILRVLGEGCNGFVYLCRVASTPHVLLALKVLSLDPSLDPKLNAQLRACFQNEIEICRRLNHPSLLQPFDSIIEENFLAYSMEYIESKNLTSWISGKSSIQFQDGINILLQVCEGVNAMHQAGIVHSGLKPGNVLMTRNGLIHISDFAIARTANLKRAAEAKILAGTIDYQSPEYLARGEISELTDVYAIGAIAFELFTGKTPFEGLGAYRMMELKAKDEAPFAHKVNPAVPRPLSGIIARALARNVGDRYQSVNEISEDLGHLRSLPNTPGVISYPGIIESTETTGSHNISLLNEDETPTLEFPEEAVVDTAKRTPVIAMSAPNHPTINQQVMLQSRSGVLTRVIRKARSRWLFLALTLAISVVLIGCLLELFARKHVAQSNLHEKQILPNNQEIIKLPKHIQPSQRENERIESPKAIEKAPIITNEYTRQAAEPVPTEKPVLQKKLQLLTVPSTVTKTAKPKKSQIKPISKIPIKSGVKPAVEPQLTLPIPTDLAPAAQPETFELFYQAPLSSTVPAFPN